jgi:hypothetical protein
MINEYGTVGGMRIGRGNRSTRRKHSSVPLSPLQIPRDLTWNRTWTAAMGSRRLTVFVVYWKLPVHLTAPQSLKLGFFHK